jgi:enoyl-CoA hydratase/carnithine racemase
VLLFRSVNNLTQQAILAPAPLSTRFFEQKTDMNAPADTTLIHEEPVSFAASDGIAWITLNRPKQYNALSSAVLRAMHAHLDAIARDESLHVTVISAHGSAFCAGHDLKEMQGSKDPAFVADLFKQCSNMMLKIAALPVPVVAEVQGMATAAGCQLVAQCDLAVSADTAKFAVSGINLGLFCSTPAVALSRTITRKRAAEMLMTGEFIDAPTALSWGLVNRVVPASALRETTLALCNSLKSKPRASLAAGKALFYRQLEMGIAGAYADASATIACNFHETAAQEGISAFLEKRKPNWSQS